MRSLSVWIAGLGLALVVVGTAILPLTGPGFTHALSARFSLAEEARLTPQRMLQVAEQVRAFVLDADGGTLPPTVDGRPGFDDAAVSHLIDVRQVLSSAKLFTGLVTALVTVWIAIELSRKRTARIAAALRVGAVLSLVFVAAAALFALTDFDSFFTAFHGLFFRSGTWTFPYDSLLIQTFPEPFWATAGGSWAALTILGAGVLAGLAQLLTKSERNRSAEPSEQ